MPRAARSPTAAAGGCLDPRLAASLWAMGSQGVAAVCGVPADGVAIGSQFGRPRALSSPATGPLTSGVGGAPRGIRTPNRQIRSLVLCVDLVGSRRICPAHVGRPVDLVGSRRVPSDRLDDQRDDQATRRRVLRHPDHDSHCWSEHQMFHEEAVPGTATATVVGRASATSSPPRQPAATAAGRAAAGGAGSLPPRRRAAPRSRRGRRRRRRRVARRTAPRRRGPATHAATTATACRRAAAARARARAWSAGHARRPAGRGPRLP
jgi:hypothetical protein